MLSFMTLRHQTASIGGDQQTNKQTNKRTNKQTNKRQCDFYRKREREGENSRLQFSGYAVCCLTIAKVKIQFSRILFFSPLARLKSPRLGCTSRYERCTLMYCLGIMIKAHVVFIGATLCLCREWWRVVFCDDQFALIPMPTPRNQLGSLN